VIDFGRTQSRRRIVSESLSDSSYDPTGARWTLHNKEETMPQAFNRALAFMIALATLLAAGNALAQSWPSRAVRIVVPFGPALQE